MMCSFTSGLHLYQAIAGLQSIQFVHKAKLAKGFNMFCADIHMSFVATSKWAVETFCTRKQMSLWTKCFHLPVQAVHFCGCFCHPQKFIGHLPQPVLHGHHCLNSSFFRMPAISLSWTFDCIVLFVCFFEHFLKVPHVKPINVLADNPFKQNSNCMCTLLSLV